MSGSLYADTCFVTTWPSTGFSLKHANDVFKLVDDYVLYFNNDRPAYALSYNTPVQFRIEQRYSLRWFFISLLLIDRFTQPVVCTNL